MKKWAQTIGKLTLIWVVFAIAATSCSPSRNEVNVYSGRHYQADEKLFRRFTELTGIQVNLIKADTDQLINRIGLEGANSPADLLITADAARLAAAAERGLLQSFGPDDDWQAVPAAFRDPQNRWIGLTKRARVIVYHKDRVSPSELTTFEDLTAPRWKGRVLVRSSQSHYNQTLLASMVAALGSEAAETWAAGLVANMARPPQGNDRDQVKALAAGVGDVAIVNTYYMGLLLNSLNEEERNVAAQCALFFPNQDDRGAHVNVSGAGLAAHAPNREHAIRLVEFLLSEEAQQVFASETYEYPVITSVPLTPLLEMWGSFKEDTMPMHTMIQHISEAMMIFNRTGWN